MKAQPTKSRTGLVVVISSLLVIGGVVGYIFWKKAKDKKDAQTKADADKLETAKTDALSSVDKAMADLKTKLSETPKTDDKPTDVKAFQDWMDTYHPNWVNGKNLNKGGGYGNFGSATQGAWSTWKTEFQNPRGTIGTIIPKTLPFTTTIQSNVISKGDTVYSRMSTISLFQYPDGNSIMGQIFYLDSTKPIGVFDSYVEGFAKVLFNKNGVTLNGFLIKAPYTAYVYKSLIKK